MSSTRRNDEMNSYFNELMVHELKEAQRGLLMIMNGQLLLRTIKLYARSSEPAGLCYTVHKHMSRHCGDPRSNSSAVMLSAAIRTMMTRMGCEDTYIDTPGRLTPIRYELASRIVYAIQQHLEHREKDDVLVTD